MNFSSAGSADPENQPLTYQWNFGDATTSTAANPSHTYGAVGTYTATLTVTDNVAQHASTQVKVVVVDLSKQIRISSTVGARPSRSLVRVRITVVDGFGKPVRSVLVKGVWAGTTTAPSASTNSAGVATFYRRTTKSAGFTTTKVSKIGRTWDGVNGSTGVSAAVR
jgi:PKD repeat protein